MRKSLSNLVLVLVRYRASRLDRLSRGLDCCVCVASSVESNVASSVASSVASNVASSVASNVASSVASIVEPTCFCGEQQRRRTVAIWLKVAGDARHLLKEP